MPPLPGSYGLVIVISGILASLLGWASISTLLTAVEWYLFSFTRAQQNMEVAEQSRAQLAEALKDLDRAYFRLQRSNVALVAARKAAEEANRFKAEFVTNPIWLDYIDASCERKTRLRAAWKHITGLKL